MRTFSYFTFLLVTSITAVASAQPGTFFDLGDIGQPGSYVFNTDNSLNVLPTVGNTDTELGLWDSSGILLASDDDGSALNFWSEITMTLASGEYYLGISEFDSVFEDGFLNTGTGFEAGETADLVLNINGVQAGEFIGASDALDQETAFFRVNIVSAVPEPSSAMLLFGVGGMVFCRRQRK